MTFIMYMVLFCLVLGLVAVASNPSPYFAALGLVAVAGMGCALLVGHGGGFLSLVLFLIYLGGMLVVFAYSAALAAEPYPESWGDRSVMTYGILYMVGVVLLARMFWGEWCEFSWLPSDDLVEWAVLRGDVGGVAAMYSLGGLMLVVVAVVLLLTLFVVLELTRGASRGALRAI
uniref:NADH-ubiquinone oxidoreductase chain 6 n=1 Tax=Pseudorhombus dupliciocellatus TaxID=367197 RepID=A0A0X8VUQ3_9PLEU|nr:NADH dehydrogenase subunit 6 [Pseudorhombus dupliciocellatus]AID59794.1 NADH dehydrogenase subunit 6 [Pseudorhombus dupliciocellatus]